MTRRGDYAVGELSIAAAVALTLTISLGLLLRSVANKQARVREIFPVGEVPIRVRPVIDLQSPELLKYGGRARAKLPEAWRVKPPQEPVPEKPAPAKKARVSTAAKDDPNEIPADDVQVSDAGEPDEVSDAGVTDDAGIAEGPEGEGGAAPGGDPEGSQHGSDAGTSTDPLMRRAAGRYNGRIVGFLRSGWRCPAGASGTCVGSVQVSGLVVASASISSCTDPMMQPAAQALMGGKVGQSVPPPPEKYPQFARSQWTVTLPCN